MGWSSLSRYPLNTFRYTWISTQKSTFLSFFLEVNVACESKWVLIASGNYYNRKNCKNSTVLYYQSISSHLLRDTSWVNGHMSLSDGLRHSPCFTLKACVTHTATSRDAQETFTHGSSPLLYRSWNFSCEGLSSGCWDLTPVLLWWCMIAMLTLESQCHALNRLFGPQLQNGLSSPYYEITLQKEGGGLKHRSCPLEEDQTLTLSYCVSSIY